jgi:hypothetical protein
MNMGEDSKDGIEPKKESTCSEKDLLVVVYVVAKKEEMKLNESVANGMALLFESPRHYNHCCDDKAGPYCCGCGDD